MNKLLLILFCFPFIGFGQNSDVYTGYTPYESCYGSNTKCKVPAGYSQCSFIKVNAPNNSPVIVIVKKNQEVFHHAYISAGDNFKFNVGNGLFQVFFYYGKDWSKDKFMKKTYCGVINGGFLKHEVFSKDDPVTLNNGSYTYTLELTSSGNLSTKATDEEEMF